MDVVKEKIHTCGKSNSYSKTDKDATFMRMKPANYEISKTRKYKNDISRIENMDYTELGDYYTSKNNKRLTVNKIVKRKSKTGYISEKTIYTSEDCSNCQHKNKCVKGHNCKTPLDVL